MDLNQLRYFMTVAQREHITKSADDLNITQSALSRVISRLEDELGVPLFNRVGRHISINDYGKVVLLHTQRIFMELEDLKQHMADLREGICGDIRIASSFPAPESTWILRAIRGMIFSAPDLKIQMYQMNPLQIKAALENRTIDIGITMPYITASSDTIQWKELYSERVGIILSKDNPLAQKQFLTLSDLRNERFFCNNSSTDILDLTHILCQRADFTPQIQFAGDFHQLIGEAISRNLGISFISESKFFWEQNRSDPADPKMPWEENIVFRLFDDNYCRRYYGIASCKDIYYTKATELLVSQLFQNAPIENNNDYKFPCESI